MACSQTRRVVPLDCVGWVLRCLVCFFTSNNENKKYAKRIHRSAALNTGDTFLHQLVHMSAMGPRFASYFAIGATHLHLVVCFERGVEMSRPLGRPIGTVMA